MLQNKSGVLNNYDSGFSLVELLFVLCIAGILASVAAPVFSNWLPDYRLRSKAKELYSDMYLAKMKAIKENSKYKIYFYRGVNDSYSLKSADGDIEKTVVLPSSDYKIGFGCGSATRSAKKSGGPPPEDPVGYASDVVTFNSRGTGSSGYVYLDNDKGSSYAIGSFSSGVIFMRKWDKSDNTWK